MVHDDGACLISKFRVNEFFVRVGFFDAIYEKPLKVSLINFALRLLLVTFKSLYTLISSL